jgi:hypothetical protein
MRGAVWREGLYWRRSGAEAEPTLPRILHRANVEEVYAFKQSIMLNIFFFPKLMQSWSIWGAGWDFPLEHVF